VNLVTVRYQTTEAYYSGITKGVENMKALVTGGTGFIGSHVVRVLREAGHTVRVLHRPGSKLNLIEDLEYESALGDVLDEDALCRASEDCDWVFHIAAVADYWRTDHRHMFEVNVEGTRRVLKAARETGVGRVIFTSSAASIGMRHGDQLSDENDAFNLPPSEFPYGYSKAQAEEVVTDAVAKGQQAVILNPVVVMGPGDINQISGSFITQIRRFGRFTPLSSGGIGVVDVRDVAHWHVAAAIKGISGERYILGTANYTYTDWFAMIAKTVGVGRPFFQAPDFILPAVVKVVDAARRLRIPVPVDADQVRLGGRKVYFDYQKAWSAFGLPRIEMQQSLKDTYEWYKQHGVIR
jgi:dihydroflavonol-4-reductase